MYRTERRERGYGLSRDQHRSLRESTKLYIGIQLTTVFILVEISSGSPLKSSGVFMCTGVDTRVYMCSIMAINKYGGKF